MSTEVAAKAFPCSACGAKLQFAPGTTTLICPHCGAANQIPTDGPAVHEEDFLAAIRAFESSADQVEPLMVTCGSCGASTTLAVNVTAAICPFCGSPLVTAGAAHRQIKPECLLAFAITAPQAMQAYQSWLASLWFAPSALKRDALSGRLQGVYIPAWTYDSRAETDYTGERGDDYWDTQTYTETVNGKSETRTRQVRKTRWSSASGHVQNVFDNLLILAARSLPKKKAEALEPWDLENLLPYKEEYLAGFIAQSYNVDMEEGFEEAKQHMVGDIDSTICRDIGGDHQRIGWKESAYFEITFKHLLLPVWLASYRYQEQVYQFLINARTGEVQGERPWSWVKITLTVLAVIALVVTIVIFSRS